MALRDRLDRRLYPDHASRWDDEAFRVHVLDVLEPTHTLLDLGAGAGRVEQMDFRGKAGRICGLDPDPRVLDNPLLDEGRVGFGEHVPWEDETFDVAIADNVFEHLERPATVLRELRRVLKPGGRLLFKTPNRRHYMPRIAARTPLWFHQWFNALRGRAEADTFPTVYRANTPDAVRQLAARTGFEVEAVHLLEGRPEYLRITVPTYLVGAAYERLVNRFEALARYRIVLIAVLRRV